MHRTIQKYFWPVSLFGVWKLLVALQRAIWLKLCCKIKASEEQRAVPLSLIGCSPENHHNCHNPVSVSEAWQTPDAVFPVRPGSGYPGRPGREAKVKVDRVTMVTRQLSYQVEVLRSARKQNITWSKWSMTLKQHCPHNSKLLRGSFPLNWRISSIQIRTEELPRFHYGGEVLAGIHQTVQAPNVICNAKSNPT